MDPMSHPLTDVTPLTLPSELWLQVFSFLSWGDKLNVRCTCVYFRQLLDRSRPLWRGYSVALWNFSRYNQRFWRSLRERNIRSVQLRAGRRKHLKQMCTWLPQLEALQLHDWRDTSADELKLLGQLQQLHITSCSTSLRRFDFLFPLCEQLTQLSICNVQLTCPPPHLLAAISQLTRLTSLLLHHDGSVHFPSPSHVLTHLPLLTQLSWTTTTYKMLTVDFFSRDQQPGHILPLSDLHLMNYDASVTPDVLQPLLGLRSLSVFHLWSVPGPICHLQTWLTALTRLHSLSVHGGHPLAAYADFLPHSLVSLTVCVDLQTSDLDVVSQRLPHLEHLHLEPWNSSSDFIRLLPQMFPQLRTLRIRHGRMSDEDFLQIQHLQHLQTLEILDSYHRPDPADPTCVVYKPSPRLLQLISELQRRTNHRVAVITCPHRPLLTCQCA